MLLPSIPKSTNSPLKPAILPPDVFPTVFHLWGLQTRSSLYDFQALDLVSSLVCDSAASNLVPLNKYGVLTDEQLSFVFTAILRLWEVPVSYVGSPYVTSSETVSVRGDSEKKCKAARPIALLIVYSMAGESAMEENGIMERLENLLHSVETFCHPSNHGRWTRAIMQTVEYLVDFFVFRWNLQETGESSLPKERDLTVKMKDRFVKALRNVAFLGIHSKSSTVVSSALEAIHHLSYLSPDLILPRVLQEVYPSLQGLVETHRTLSSLKVLTVLTRTLARCPRYAIHMTTLLSQTIPGIDANDLNKTLQSLSLIQAIALNVPFNDLTTDNSSGLAMDYVSQDVGALEEMPANDENEDFKLPEISSETLEEVLKSSSAAFGDFVVLFLGRVFTLLENLPDMTSSSSSSGKGSSRDQPESHVVNTLPLTMIAILGSVSSDLFSTVLDHVINFVINNVINSATDAVAHICGCLVKVNSNVAFPKLFPLLYSNIKNEVEENGAGSTRSGSEILPRDRALIWYLSTLNMCLAHSGKNVLDFKEQLLELTVFLRERCRGSIVYHISNTIHHTLVTLSSIYIQDYRLVANEDGSVTTADWAAKIDPQALNPIWHVPQREEIEFAVELYRTHCERSINNLKQITTENTDGNGSLTEFSDAVSSNVTYMRTATSGMALLFDPDYPDSSTTTTSQHNRQHKRQYSSNETKDNNAMEMDIDGEDESDLEMSEEEEVVAGLEGEYDDSDSDSDDDDDDGDMDSSDTVELKKLREYPVGYFFGKDLDVKRNDSLYNDLHEMRINVGKCLHDVHGYLMAHKESDILSFKATLYAFKVWFSDVRIERSAKFHDSMFSLYHYDIRNFRMSGLRKDYPRPILVRRAGLYHSERLIHSSSPRTMTDLEKTLLNDVVKSSLSIYPDIRRNAQSSLESGAKVLIRSRATIYPWLLKEITTALHDQEYNRAESGFRVINIKVMQTFVKRDYKHIVQYCELLQRAVGADHPQLSSVAIALYGLFACSVKYPLGKIEIGGNGVEDIEPTAVTEEMSNRIIRMKEKKAKMRQDSLSQLKSLVDYLVKQHTGGSRHWKLEALDAGLLTVICSSPEMPVQHGVVALLVENVYNPHPGVKMMSLQALFKIIANIFTLACSGYDFDRFLLTTDEENLLSPGMKFIESNKEGFTEEFKQEMANFDKPKYFDDRGSYGWLVWPEKFQVDKVPYQEQVKFSETDQQLIETLGSFITQDWVRNMIKRNSEEPRSEEDAFDVTNAILFRFVLRQVELGYTQITLDEFLELLRETYYSNTDDDKNIHRCVAEICAGMAESLKFSEPEPAQKKLSVMQEIFSRAVNEDLVHETVGYWQSFLWWSGLYIDYRRLWPIIKILNDYRLNSDPSTTMLKESSKISFLRKSITVTGWHYQPVESLLDHLWDNINHHSQGVREEVAKSLAVIYKTRYSDSFESVEEFVRSNRENGPLGVQCYTMSEGMRKRVVKAFDQLEEWRLERERAKEASGSVKPYSNNSNTSGGGSNGEQGSNENDSYILAAKTLSVWLERLLKTSYGIALVPLLPETIIPALLHFLNVRDEQELMLSSVSLFKLLGNIPYPLQSVQMMIDTIVNVGAKATTWHQRMSVLSYIQAFFFRQLFMMNDKQRLQLVETVTSMLEDVQLEVRLNAAETLAGLIRCSREEEQRQLTRALDERFSRTLSETAGAARRPQAKRGTGTPDGQALIKRHAAVLGLGALVQAFPYHSPPPKWIPKVLATMAVKAASDPGMIGKAVKSTLSDFKKTRQDTWPIDSKVFTTEQLEDLEGVLWKNYFV